ncbi:MAG: o-succinylbenzoate synthase [Crocinitomicaceae bacterium]|nr:o-succinylbenzoate synthase [Crocinitomicaceae bacterium]MBK8925389.1 o-succinylbenzoate synthase [Crocinitomicaceae bacterium]
MKLQAKLSKHTLTFKTPGGTSRGVLHSKNSWIIQLFEANCRAVRGTGEASIIENLSPDWNEEYERQLEKICSAEIPDSLESFSQFREIPSLRFALESAFLDLKNGGNGICFPSDFTEGRASIPINGLVWMGDQTYMQNQIEEKLKASYTCIKMKVGAIDFETELEVLKSIRKRYSKNEIILRVDANGAFSEKDVMQKLDHLAALDIHSIEQPVKAGQTELMQKICLNTPLPIALDEELIGIHDVKEKNELLRFIKPQFIILKPSLLGGFLSCDEWIAAAEKNLSGWWITSALESNIGLSAIAQYTYTKNVSMHQGLGTGQLFTNNFSSDLEIRHGELWGKSSIEYS